MSNWRVSVEDFMRQNPGMNYYDACRRIGKMGARKRKSTKWKMKREAEARARMERMGLG